MTPYFRMMSATRGKLEVQRRMRELLRDISKGAAEPAINSLTAAIQLALYGADA
jgi:hypothetical protein